MIPLTKTLDPVDLVELAPELAVVDALGIGQQHSWRRWEYSLALRALAQHRQGYVPPSAGYLVLDVGGAGSPFYRMVREVDLTCTVVDPKVNSGIEGYRAPDDPADAVISVSTIEHVKHPLPFLEACHRVLAPGGLLFLTMDACDYHGADHSHFSWMRERIYNLERWETLRDDCVEDLGFRLFGEVDWTYHGDHVYDYTFASLALTKEA